MIKPLQIGNVTLENNLILAPMAGVTDLPFRLLCKEQGAGLLCMEMVSAKAILYKNKNTEELLSIDTRENPVSLQLFGSDPVIMGEIAKQIEERPFDILDINMGCPVPKVVNNGDGSALMKNPVLAGKIIELKNNAAHCFTGSYDEYTAYKATQKQTLERIPAPVVSTSTEPKNSYYRSKEDRAADARRRTRIKKIEDEIGALECEEEQLNADLSSPQVTADFTLLQEKCNRLEEIKNLLDGLYEEYETLI